MRDAWEFIRDRWETDSVWRDQIILAAIVGLIGLAYALVELGAQARWAPAA